MDIRAHLVWQAGRFLSPPVSGAQSAPLTGYLGVCVRAGAAGPDTHNWAKAVAATLGIVQFLEWPLVSESRLQ
jgi:hypothetical protein